jgi:hypothetical protein
MLTADRTIEASNDSLDQLLDQSDPSIRTAISSIDDDDDDLMPTRVEPIEDIPPPGQPTSRTTRVSTSPVPDGGSIESHSMNISPPPAEIHGRFSATRAVTNTLSTAQSREKVYWLLLPLVALLGGLGVWFSQMTSEPQSPNRKPLPVAEEPIVVAPTFKPEKPTKVVSPIQDASSVPEAAPDAGPEPVAPIDEKAVPAEELQPIVIPTPKRGDTMPKKETPIRKAEKPKTDPGRRAKASRKGDRRKVRARKKPDRNRNPEQAQTDLYDKATAAYGKGNSKKCYDLYRTWLKKADMDDPDYETVKDRVAYCKEHM